MQKKKNNLFKKVFVFLLSFFCFIPNLFSFTPFIASASVVSGYSSPLADLMKDETFVKENYPPNKADHSLQIIQVAESLENEVFIYVYQPAEMFIATSINMSLEKEMEDNKIYYLDYIGKNETFYKYKINDLEVTKAETRHYNIVSIFRPYYKNIDIDVTDENVTEVAFPVATCFSITTNEDGTYSYCNSGTETIEVITKYTSYVRYDNGSKLFPYEHDAFFVAFDTDRNMERLMEADVSYIYYTYDCYKDLLAVGGDGTQIASLEFGHYSDYDNHTHSDKVTANKTLSSENVEKISLGLIFRQKYSWSQIESVGEFINDDDKELTSEALENLANKNWVLNFHHAEFNKGTEYLMASPVKNYESGTVVENVTILRLKFETDGVTYNLGVIDNKQDSTTEPAGSGYSELEKLKDAVADFFDKFKWVFGAIVLVIIMSLLAIFTPIFTFIWKGIAFFFKILWYVISAPFVYIKSKFKKE